MVLTTQMVRDKISQIGPTTLEGLSNTMSLKGVEEVHALVHAVKLALDKGTIKVTFVEYEDTTLGIYSVKE